MLKDATDKHNNLANTNIAATTAAAIIIKDSSNSNSNSNKKLCLHNDIENTPPHPHHTTTIKAFAAPAKPAIINRPIDTIVDHANGTNLLVLQVTERVHQREKVLRALDERAGLEREVVLRDGWFHERVLPGDTVNLVNARVEDNNNNNNNVCKAVVDDHAGFVVMHPQMLVSGSKVGSSYGCLRRTVLDERVRGTNTNAAALYGTMTHELFQGAMKRGVCDAAELATMAKAGRDQVDFGFGVGTKTVGVCEVMDIEENVWAPRYGLKGNIDASVRVAVVDNKKSNAVRVRVMPLELKTGKRTAGQANLEHRAQLMLYTLLMSER
eukprot:jgi/Chlat1/7570/Chrsp63S07065